MPWPKLILFRVVHAPPHVVSNLFKDYTAGPSYMPGVLAAKVLSRHGNTAIVEYTVKAPIIGQVSYTVQNTLTQHGNQTKVAWKLVHSTLAKSSDGSLNMEPYGNNQTLICYTNLCVPIVSFVPGLQAEALKTAQVTVNALAKESQRRAHAAH